MMHHPRRSRKQTGHGGLEPIPGDHYNQFGNAISPNLHGFGLGEETRVPGGNPPSLGRTYKLHAHRDGNRTWPRIEAGPWRCKATECEAINSESCILFYVKPYNAEILSKGRRPRPLPKHPGRRKTRLAHLLPYEHIRCNTDITSRASDGTMSERDEESFKPVQLEQQAADSFNAEPEMPQSMPSAPSLSDTEEKTSPPASSTPSAEHGQKWSSALNQFKLKRFFVLRPGTLDNAIEDIKSLVDQKQDGPVESVWLLVEVDHWNNEKERVVLITEKSLLICKYDFIMLNCEQIQRIPLNLVDRITQGAFTFPPRSLLTREGEGVRVFWDKLREPSLTSRWNPFATDFPYTTLTYHPVRNANEKLSEICELLSFKEHLIIAAQKAHSLNPVPGKANGVLLLNQPVLIEAYVGLMSTLGNQNKLGYCLARGNVGF